MSAESGSKRVEPVPPAPRVQAQPQATRCPYCHDACEASADVCACADCLSRHHTSCWTEAGACSVCRSTERLERAATERRPARSPADYGKLIDGWLKLGCVYNAGLTVLSLLILQGTVLDRAGDLVAGALAANILFLLGPATDLTAHRLGYRGDQLRNVTFTLGFLFALALAGLVCLFADAPFGPGF